MTGLGGGGTPFWACGAPTAEEVSRRERFESEVSLRAGPIACHVGGMREAA